jgi:hypothetical protein
MKLYKFAARVGSRVALTKDQTGANLPKDGAPWKLIGTTEVEADGKPRIGASSDEIVAAVEKDGFIIWPVQIQDVSTAA